VLLQNHYNKYGKNEKPSTIFSFELIETCETVEHAFTQEKYWIQYYNSHDRTKGFNLTEGGEMNCWKPEHIKKRKETVRNQQKPIYIYNICGKFVGKYRSIIDISEQMNLNKNAVSNALNRGIRYKNYLFYREKKIFDKYTPQQSGIIVYINVYKNNILIDTIKGLKECADKYNIKYNTLNTYCRRGTVFNGLRFEKSYL
jgi:hypothetical protein